MKPKCVKQSFSRGSKLQLQAKLPDSNNNIPFPFTAPEKLPKIQEIPRKYQNDNYHKIFDNQADILCDARSQNYDTKNYLAFVPFNMPKNTQKEEEIIKFEISGELCHDIKEQHFDD